MSHALPEDQTYGETAGGSVFRLASKPLPKIAHKPDSVWPDVGQVTGISLPLAGPNYSHRSAAKLVTEGSYPRGYSSNGLNRSRPAVARAHDLNLLFEGPGQDEDLRSRCTEFLHQDVNVKGGIRRELYGVFGGCRLHNSPGYVGGECAASGVHDTDLARGRRLTCQQVGKIAQIVTRGRGCADQVLPAGSEDFIRGPAVVPQNFPMFAGNLGDGHGQAAGVGSEERVNAVLAQQA